MSCPHCALLRTPRLPAPTTCRSRRAKQHRAGPPYDSGTPPLVLCGMPAEQGGAPHAPAMAMHDAAATAALPVSATQESMRAALCCAGESVEVLSVLAAAAVGTPVVEC